MENSLSRSYAEEFEEYRERLNGYLEIARATQITINFITKIE